MPPAPGIPSLTEPATPMQSAVSFAVGAVQGAFTATLTSAAIGYVAGAAGVAAAPYVLAAGAAVLTVAAINALANGGAAAIAESVTRLSNGQGTRSDWQIMGNVFGGVAGGIVSSGFVQAGMAAGAADAASAEVLGITSGGAGGSAGSRAGYNGVQGPAQVTPRTTRSGGPGVQVRFPDRSVMDVSPVRVKEFVPNPHPKAPPGTLQRVEFDIAQPGTKGLKRDPTMADLEWLL